MIKAAPCSFAVCSFAAALLIGYVAYRILETRFEDRIASANQTIKLIETKLSVGPSENAAEKIDELKDQISHLKARSEASLTFQPPAWNPVKEGGYIVTSLITVNTGGVKSGVVIGVDGRDIEGIGCKPLLNQGGVSEPYLLPAHKDLGVYRWYLTQVSGAYRLSIKTSRKVDITIRYRFEDRQGEANVVQWKAP